MINSKISNVDVAVPRVLALKAQISRSIREEYHSTLAAKNMKHFSQTDPYILDFEHHHCSLYSFAQVRLELCIISCLFAQEFH